MFLIQQVTQNPLQTQNVVLPNGNIVSLTLYFVPMQYGWFITNLTYQSFILNGLRITNSPNMLRQFLNQIPFGLACISTANSEPTQQQSFSSGVSKLYILDSTEVQEYEAYLELGMT